MLLPILILISVSTYVLFVKEDPAALNQEQQRSAEQADVDAAKQRVEEESEDEPLKNDSQDESTPVVSGVVTLTGLTFTQANQMVNASVAVAGADSGICSFIFTDGDGRAIKKTAKLSSGTCSISVSEAEFTMIGGYELTARFGDKSISKDVTIN